MKYDDLPAALKAQVDAKLDKTSTKRTSQRVARAGTTTRLRCATGTCREVCRSVAAMERHVEGHGGGGRYECVL